MITITPAAIEAAQNLTLEGNLSAYSLALLNLAILQSSLLSLQNMMIADMRSLMIAQLAATCGVPPALTAVARSLSSPSRPML